MSAILHSVRHPSTARPAGLAANLRSAGITAAMIGVALVGVTLIANLAVAADTGTGLARTLAWSFGLTITGFAALKTGIALTLIGILLRVRDRIDAVKSSLPALAPAPGHPAANAAEVDTDFGRVTRTAGALGPLSIHKMAQKMWAPMLLMGPMIVVAGLVLSIIQKGTDG